jgi:hypothetical protein
MKKRLRKKLEKKEYDLRCYAPFLRRASETGFQMARVFEQVRTSLAALLKDAL